MALDLTRDVPRSPFAELDGFPWLPRMIDKAHALYAGTLGDYSPYPCPGDKGFLGHFGLDAAPLGELIKGGASDDEIVAYVRANAKGGEEAKEAFRRTQRQPATGLMWLVVVVFRWLQQRKHPQRDFGRADSLAKILAIEEGHELP